jgi:hypothetical protein
MNPEQTSLNKTPSQKEKEETNKKNPRSNQKNKIQSGSPRAKEQPCSKAPPMIYKHIRKRKT